jgi:hypothetical protein
MEDHAQSSLAPLTVGDRLPWRLDEDGKPMWLTISEVLGPAHYAVRYPDGHVVVLTDSA